MKMPMNWAKEFAEFECTPQEFADRMTMSGSKVETYECEADGIKNVVVGKILEIVPHPDSDHMVVCQVDVGRDAPVQIVTGANNLKVGDLVPAALHVAKLPGGKEIRRGKLRGVESGGMLCSLSELGLTTHDFSKRRRGRHSGAGRGMARGHRRCEGAWYGRRVRGF